MKILVALLMMLSFLNGAAFAAVPDARPTIVFFYVDDLNAADAEKSGIRRETIEKFTDRYSRTYTLRLGDSYAREFDVSRLTDLSGLDRFGLLPRLVADRVDYAVFYCIQPLRTKGGVLQLPTTTSSVHLRIFDLRKNTYICDSVFSYSSTWAWPSSHMERLYADIDSKVFAVYFPVKI